MHVPAAYTSQACSVCRAVDPKSRESQARFRCTRCGHTEHADVNAARNILAAGQAVTACGDLAIGRSAKQELVGIREEVPHQPALELAGIPRL
ncbi:zinc ribbon domain-containing protein [Saccharopolyspora sp. NPDC002376]